MSDVIPSATLQHRITREVARLWQQLHPFRHRITEDDAHRPTSAGLPIASIPSGKTLASGSRTAEIVRGRGDDDAGLVPVPWLDEGGFENKTWLSAVSADWRPISGGGYGWLMGLLQP